MIWMSEVRYFILVGDMYAWQTSFLKNMWGFAKRTIGSWHTSNVGDYVAFYVTSPIKKIIGHGRITKKFESDDILWPDEIMFTN